MNKLYSMELPFSFPVLNDFLDSRDYQNRYICELHSIQRIKSPNNIYETNKYTLVHNKYSDCSISSALKHSHLLSIPIA